MDHVGFALRRLPDAGEVVDIEVNGRRLADLAREVELPFALGEGAPAIAGGYAGMPVSFLRDGVETHYLGGPGSDVASGPAEKTLLLACECGEPGCWPLMARVVAGEEVVEWCDFEQPHRHGRWRHDGLGPFRFARAQYLVALAAVKSP